MEQIEIYFEGYCPESLLKGRKVEMKLNQDDFWESLETGMQMTVFPPYAAILKWRGKGKFRESSNQIASDELFGLVMTATQIAKGQEIFPDQEKIIHNKVQLADYLKAI